MIRNERHPIRWAIWALACGFYLYSYIVRIQPGLMIHTLAKDLGVSIALLSRLLMGFGASLSFVGMVWVCSHWFSGKTIALMSEGSESSWPLRSLLLLTGIPDPPLTPTTRPRR